MKEIESIKIQKEKKLAEIPYLPDFDDVDIMC